MFITGNDFWIDILLFLLLRSSFRHDRLNVWVSERAACWSTARSERGLVQLEERWIQFSSITESHRRNEIVEKYLVPTELDRYCGLVRIDRNAFICECQNCVRVCARSSIVRCWAKTAVLIENKLIAPGCNLSQRSMWTETFFGYFCWSQLNVGLVAFTSDR